MLCGRPDNIVWMLYQCCVSTKIPSFRQRSGNIVWMLWQCHSQQWGLMSLETIFRQHCVNVVSPLVPNIVLDWFRSRMTVTFKFEFSTHLQHQHASLHWHNHIYKHWWVILHTMSVELMDRWWILKKFPQWIDTALFECKLPMSETHSSTVFKVMFFILKIIKSCFLKWSFWP